MPAIKIKKRVEEEIRRKTSSAVRVEPRDILQYDMDANNLLLLHLSKSAREEAKKLGERFGDVVMGARMAFLARLTGVRFIPAPNSYAWTAEALEKVKGVANLDYSGVVEAMLASQRWDAGAVVVYTERGFSKELSLKPVRDEAVDKFAEDLSWFRSTSATGYLAGIELLDKLSNGDKVLMLSTMRALDDTIKVGKFGEPIALDLEKMVPIKADEKLSERPIFDGYTRIHFDDPEFKNFDKSVEEELEEIAKREVLDREKLFKIWRAVKDAVHAFVPAYYNFLGLEPETYVPKAVAKAVADVYKVYYKVQELKKLGHGLHIKREVSLVMELAHIFSYDDIEVFARTRIPYLIYRIGANLGTAFDLAKVYENVYNGPERIRDFIKPMMDLGIVVSPEQLREIEQEIERERENRIKTNPNKLIALEDMFLKAVAKRIMDPKEQALASVYTAFYGMGVPATKFFVPVVREDRLSDRLYDYSMTFMTTTNMKLFIDDNLLDEKVVDPVTKFEASVSKIFFGAVDTAISRYIYGLRQFLSGDELTPENPAIYRGMLYIYSDRDFAKGYKESIKKDTSPHTEMLRHLQSLILNIEMGKYLVLEYGEEVKKLYDKKDKEKLKKEEQAKIDEYMNKMKEVSDTIKSIESKMNSLAKIYNPRYIEYLGFVSNSIYKSFIDSFNRQPKAGGDRAEKQVRKMLSSSIGAVREHLSSYATLMSSIIPAVQGYEHFLRYLSRSRMRKERKYSWSKTEERLPLFFELIERERLEAQRREEEQRRAEALAKQQAEETKAEEKQKEEEKKEEKKAEEKREEEKAEEKREEIKAEEKQQEQAVEERKKVGETLKTDQA